MGMGMGGGGGVSAQHVPKTMYDNDESGGDMGVLSVCFGDDDRGNPKERRQWRAGAQVRR